MRIEYMFILLKKTPVFNVFADNYQSYDNAQHGTNIDLSYIWRITN